MILSGISKQRTKTNTSSQGGQSNNYFRFKGKIIPRRNVEKFDLKFNITGEMVPTCRVLVYLVRSDKEVVADSIVYSVEEKFENQVKAIYYLLSSLIHYCCVRYVCVLVL